MNKTIGLIINPIAGIGGAVGLKGSDGQKIQQIAFERGAVKRSVNRTRMALNCLQGQRTVKILCGPGEMGEVVAAELNIDYRVIPVKGNSTGKQTTSWRDTEQLALDMAELGVDLLIFAGGDGTARNIYNAVEDRLPVLGIPTGVKIHSGVFATSPSAAGKILKAFTESEFHTRLAEVIDLDEESYRRSRIADKLYGYMKILHTSSGMQNAKAASHNSDEDISGIKAEIMERMGVGEFSNSCGAEPECHYIIGAGSTLYSIKKEFDESSSLLGIDVFRGGKLLHKDVTESQLLDIVSRNNCRLIITAIGGQGHIFGRGNQQISPRVIRAIGKDNILVAATASKIYGLPQQTLIVDTGDYRLDESLRGYIKVIIGWQETLICRVL